MNAIAMSAKQANLERRRPDVRVMLRDWSVERLTDWFILSAAAFLAWSGVEQVSVCFSEKLALGFADPVFGVPFRFVLLTYGLVSLILAALCLFLVGKRSLLLGLLAWMTANGIVYWIGLWTMGWNQPYPLVAYLSLPWDISERLAGVIHAAILGCLFAGSLTCLLALRRGIAPKESVKTSCPACGGHIAFSLRNLGQRSTCPHCQAAVTLRSLDENLKISCFFCQGHIEFPAHAIGTKMQCPHCHKDITLVEPKTNVA